MPRLSLVEELTNGPIPVGSNILAEHDPSSRWQNAHVTIAAEWLKTGGKVIYHLATQPPDRVRNQLKQLGVEELEAPPEGPIFPRLAINDWYTATLDRKERSDEFYVESLNAADLSIQWAKGEKKAETVGLLEGPTQHVLRLVDNISSLDRFNPERLWVEFVLTRLIPRAQKWKQVSVIGLARGVHSDWVYKTLEGAVDGVIDFKLDEAEGEPRDLFRIRTMRTINFDRKWHSLNFGANLQVSLMK